MYSSEESSDSDSGCFKRGKKTTSEEKSSPKKDARKKHYSKSDEHRRNDDVDRRNRRESDNEKNRRHDSNVHRGRFDTRDDRHSLENRSTSSHNKTHKEHPRQRRSKSRERYDDSNKKQYKTQRDRTRSNSRDRRKVDNVERRKNEFDNRRKEATIDRKREPKDGSDKIKEIDITKRSHSKDRRRERENSLSHQSKSSHSTIKDERDPKRHKQREEFKDDYGRKKIAEDSEKSRNRKVEIESVRLKDDIKMPKHQDVVSSKHEIVIRDEKDSKKQKRRDENVDKAPKIQDERDFKKHRENQQNKEEQLNTQQKAKEPEKSVMPNKKEKDHSNKHSSNSRNHSRFQTPEHEHEKHDKFDESYGPALPPPNAASKKVERKFAGPEMPPGFKERKYDRNIGPRLPNDYEMADKEENYDNISSEDDDCMIGPLPTDDTRSEIELEREKRKIELKIQKLDRRTKEIESQMERREDWMIELPEVRKVPDLGLGPRQFRRNEQPDFSDRTSWTKTPNDSVNKEREKIDERRIAEKRRHDEAIAKRDAEQEEMARKHKKQHKRDKSLLELHEKKMKKEKKKLKDEKPERRAFNRETDLQVNRFDESRKKSAIKSASLLDDRFSRGQRKFL